MGGGRKDVDWKRKLETEGGGLGKKMLLKIRGRQSGVAGHVWSIRSRGFHAAVFCRFTLEISPSPLGGPCHIRQAPAAPPTSRSQSHACRQPECAVKYRPDEAQTCLVHTPEPPAPHA